MAERTLQEIFEEQAEQEAWLERKYPWAEILRNWVLFVLAVMLVISFIIWGLDIRTRRIADEMTATAMASWQAEQSAKETAAAEELAAIRASEEFVMSQEANEMARAFYGIRLFEEKYNYSENDLTTYARCMFNRADASGNDLIAVISQQQQFLGYDSSNPVLSKYYDLAFELIDGWHHEEQKPCDLSYQFAELTPNGIWLKNDLHADGYSRRWQA